MDSKLYIIMRKDLQDMNPGKAMAQAAHAQADFDAYIEENCGPEYLQNDTLWGSVGRWRQDRSFGTTLVLHEPLAVIKNIVETVQHSGVTVDPTYPWRNFYGDVFTSSEITCAWVFLAENAKQYDIDLMSTFALHK